MGGNFQIPHLASESRSPIEMIDKTCVQGSLLRQLEIFKLQNKFFSCVGCNKKLEPEPNI